MAEETENKVETTNQEEQADQFIKCPCCGELTLRKPLDIKSAVLEEYMASIISGVPFQHTYTLYKQISVTVSVLSKEADRKMYMAGTLLDRLLRSLPAEKEELRAYAKELSGTLQAYIYVTSIITERDGKTVKQMYPAEAVCKVCDELASLEGDICAYAVMPTPAAAILDKLVELHTRLCNESVLSTIPDVLIRAVVRTHMQLYNILMTTGFDENFWEGIELA